MAYQGVILYVLIALISIIGFLIIANYLDKAKISFCQGELTLFEQDLKDSVEKMYSRFDSVREKSLMVPCDIDRIFFIDLDRDMEASFKSLYEFPFIEDSIKTGVRENAFFIRKGKLVGSSYIGNIELKEPYFVCSDTSRGVLNLYMSGKGASAEISNTDCGNDCTFEVVELDEETAKEIIEHAKQLPAGGPMGDIDTEIEIFRETSKKVKIARRFNCGKKPGETVVEILIKGNAKNFKLIESIPKECVDYLNDYLKNMTGEYDYFKILSDPLIVWHFNSISEETIISYVLDLDLSENCLDAFESIGLGVTPESENLTQEELDALPDDPLTLNLPDEIGMGAGESSNAFSNPVWHYVSDADIINNDVFKDYLYEISASHDGTFSNSAGDATFVECSITSDKYIYCSVNADFSGSKTFYVKADDGIAAATDSFDVEVLACVNGKTMPCPKQYGVCLESMQTCANNNWHGCSDIDYLSYNQDYEAVETKCDNMDNDCDGNIDEGLMSAFYRDSDNDGYGNPLDTIEACAAPLGYIIDNTDCNDNNNEINPSALEVCDGTDNDCDGSVDEGELCDCNLNSAYWDRTSATEGESVTLTVEGSQGCNGKTVDFDIWESNWIFQDTDITTVYSTFAGTSATATWTAERTVDYMLPFHQYFFKASVDGEDDISSDDLEIIEGCAPSCPSVCGGNPDGCGGTCPLNNGASCDDDNACTYNDVCSGGTCSGTVYTCEGGVCDATALCDSLGGCARTYSPAGTFCDICKECDGSGNCVNIPDGTICGTNEICENGVCVDVVAELSASYSNLHYDPSQDRWYYDLTITESNGVGVTLSHRIRCFQSIGCESPKYDPVAKFGTNRINPNGQVTANNRWFWTTYHPDKMTETWYGTDDNGNSVEDSHIIDTP